MRETISVFFVGVYTLEEHLRILKDLQEMSDTFTHPTRVKVYRHDGEIMMSWRYAQ